MGINLTDTSPVSRQAALHRQPPPGAAKLQPEGKAASGEASLGFLDLIDVVNPLQHIPIVGHIYRAVTGDTINPAAQIAGGALFGGPLGAAASAGMVVASEIMGGEPLELVAEAMQTETAPQRVAPEAMKLVADNSAVFSMVPEVVKTITAPEPVYMALKREENTLPPLGYAQGIASDQYKKSATLGQLQQTALDMGA